MSALDRWRRLPVRTRDRVEMAAALFAAALILYLATLV